MAHFAVTDTADGRFIAHERFARGALGLAGATSEPLRIWLEDWSVSGTATDADARLRLSARHENVALELDLVGDKPAVLHGDRGVDAKGPEPGNASHYYSLPRLRAHGTVEVDGETTEIEGLAWMDREWGTSALSPGVAGWDWFALHLIDGRDLMFYRLRNADGSASPFSGGSLIDAHGGREELNADDAALTVLREWQSPKSGARYPIAWRLVVPKGEIDVTLEPRLDNQELDLSVRYWEGAVHAAATSGGAPAGDGYLELAGY
jgi:predicted secreted hydrolase